MPFLKGIFKSKNIRSGCKADSISERNVTPSAVLNTSTGFAKDDNIA